MGMGKHWRQHVTWCLTWKWCWSRSIKELLWIALKDQCWLCLQMGLPPNHNFHTVYFEKWPPFFFVPLTCQTKPFWICWNVGRIHLLSTNKGSFKGDHHYQPWSAMGFWIGLFSDNPTWRATMDYMPWICQPWIAVQNAKWLFTVFSTCIWFVWELNFFTVFSTCIFHCIFLHVFSTCHCPTSIYPHHHFSQETLIHGTWPRPGAHTEDVPDRHLQMVLTHHPDAGPRVESVLKAPGELWEAGLAAA